MVNSTNDCVTPSRLM